MTAHLSGRSKRALFQMLALGVSACGVQDETLATKDGAEPRRICDGSSDIRLAFRYNVGRTFPMETLLYSLGADFLYVDGECRYWVQTPRRPNTSDPYLIWRPYRSGTLTPTQEQALHEAIGYDDFPAGPAAAFCTQADNELHDVAIPMFWDGRNAHYCYGMFRLPSYDWPGRKELYDQGTDLTGAIRVAVSQQSVPNEWYKVYPWPFTASPETLYPEPSFEPPTYVIPEGDEATALRALRALAMSEVNTTATDEADLVLWPGGILTEPEGYERELQFTFIFSLRNELPFTDEDGLWNP